MEVISTASMETDEKSVLLAFKVIVAILGFSKVCVEVNAVIWSNFYCNTRIYIIYFKSYFASAKKTSPFEQLQKSNLCLVLSDYKLQNFLGTQKIS